MSRGILSEEERLKNYNDEHLCSLGLQTQNYVECMELIYIQIS
jgi:hypothetical protein